MGRLNNITTVTVEMFERKRNIKPSADEQYKLICEFTGIYLN